MKNYVHCVDIKYVPYQAIGQCFFGFPNRGGLFDKYVIQEFLTRLK